MSGIINKIGSKSGTVKREEPSVIRWRLYEDPGSGGQDPLGSNNDWIVSGGAVTDVPVEFAVGYFGSSTLVTEASGIFSFTETGYYHIKSQVMHHQYSGDTLWVRCYHLLSNNGTGGTYNVSTTAYSSTNDNEYSHIPQSSLVKVTDVSNDKFKLAVATQAITTTWLYEGTDGLNVTYIDFIKLGGL